MSQMMRWRRRMFVGVAVTLAAALLVVGVRYQRQIRSYLTHWKGSPTDTEPYTPLPRDDLALHVAVVGDIGDSGHRLDATGEGDGRARRDDPFDVLAAARRQRLPVRGSGAPPDDGVRAVRGRARRRRRAARDPRQPRRDAGHGDAQIAALGHARTLVVRERDGDVLVVGLDSNEPDNPEQLAWLERDAAATDGTVEDRRPAPPAVLRRVPGLEHATSARRSSRCSSATACSSCSPATTTTTSAASRSTGSPTWSPARRRAPAAPATPSFTAVSFSWHSFVELGVYPGPARRAGRQPGPPRRRRVRAANAGSERYVGRLRAPRKGVTISHRLKSIRRRSSQRPACG